MGGFGSAVLEAAADAGLDASRVRRLGIPDQFIEHGDRAELLADLGLDARGIAGPAGTDRRPAVPAAAGAPGCVNKGGQCQGRRCAAAEHRSPRRPDRPP